MDNKYKITIGILVAIIVVLLAIIAMAFVFPTNIQTDILDSKDCSLNASNFKNPINDNGVFQVDDLKSNSLIKLSQVDESTVTKIVYAWQSGLVNGLQYQIAGLNGLLIRDNGSVTFYFEKNGGYYSISSSSESEFGDILTSWQEDMPNTSNEDITSSVVKTTKSISSSTASKSTSSSSQSSSRQEDQITSDGWNPKEHEVSREQLDDGNERVNYDDGYFRVVDKDGNVLSYGY